jgi:hypothetical protein
VEEPQKSKFIFYPDDDVTNTLFGDVNY